MPTISESLLGLPCPTIGATANSRKIFSDYRVKDARCHCQRLALNNAKQTEYSFSDDLKGTYLGIKRLTSGRGFLQAREPCTLWLTTDRAYDG